MAKNTDQKKSIKSHNAFSLEEIKSIFMDAFNLYPITLSANQEKLAMVISEYKKDRLKLDELFILSLTKTVENGKYKILNIGFKNKLSQLIEKQQSILLETIDSYLKMQPRVEKKSGRPKFKLGIQKAFYLSYISLNEEDFSKLARMFDSNGFFHTEVDKMYGTGTYSYLNIPTPYHDSDLGKIRKNWLKNHIKAFEKNTKTEFIKFINNISEPTKKITIDTVTDEMILTYLRKDNYTLIFLSVDFD